MKIETFTSSGFATLSNSSDTTAANLIQNLNCQIKTWLSRHPLYKEVSRSSPSISTTLVEKDLLYVVFVINCCFEPA